MCGRYISIQTTETLEKRFQINVPKALDYKPSYNISPGCLAPVITNEKPEHLPLFEFGFTPAFADKKNSCLMPGQKVEVTRKTKRIYK